MRNQPYQEYDQEDNDSGWGTAAKLGTGTAALGLALPIGAPVRGLVKKQWNKTGYDNPFGPTLNYLRDEVGTPIGGVVGKITGGASDLASRVYKNEKASRDIANKLHGWNSGEYVNPEEFSTAALKQNWGDTVSRMKGAGKSALAFAEATPAAVRSLLKKENVELNEGEKARLWKDFLASRAAEGFGFDELDTFGKKWAASKSRTPMEDILEHLVQSAPQKHADGGAVKNAYEAVLSFLSKAPEAKKPSRYDGLLAELEKANKAGYQQKHFADGGYA